MRMAVRLVNRIAEALDRLEPEHRSMTWSDARWSTTEVLRCSMGLGSGGSCCTICAESALSIANVFGLTLGNADRLQGPVLGVEKDVSERHSRMSPGC
jgi:hypothetical protein